MSKNIYEGNIVVCKDLDDYNTFGKFNQCFFENYTDLLLEKRLLVEIGDDRYIDITEMNSFYQKILFKLGLYGKVLKTYPTEDEMKFIDGNSLYSCIEQHGVKAKIKCKNIRN